MLEELQALSTVGGHPSVGVFLAMPLDGTASPDKFGSQEISVFFMIFQVIVKKKKGC